MLASEDLSREPSRVRVALVFSRYHLQGGSERQVFMLSRDLATRGHEVHVFCRIVRAAPPAGVTLHVMPRFPLGPLLELILFSVWARAAIRRHERSHGAFDVRHGFGRTPGQDVYRVGGGSHRTYLEHAHALDRPPWLRRILAATPLQRMKAAMEDRSLRGDPAAMVIANSSMVAEDLADRHELPPNRLVVIPNGVDLDHFQLASDDERNGLRASLSLRPEHEVLLFAGAGYARKGLEPTLRALASLCSERPQLRLLVAGKDRHRSLWRRTSDRLGVSDRVIWLGVRVDLERAYGAADVFVLPTAYDAAANSTLEALACGLPVVTSTMNGAAEILEPGRYGEAVPTPVRPDDLAQAIVRWLRPDDRQAVRLAARARAEQFPAAASCERVLDVYRTLVRPSALSGAPS